MVPSLHFWISCQLCPILDAWMLQWNLQWFYSIWRQSFTWWPPNAHYSLENIHKCSYCHSWKASWQNVAHESMQCGIHIALLVSNHRHASTVAKLLVVEQRSPPKSLSQRDQNGNGFWMFLPTRMPCSNFSVTSFIETPQRQDIFSWPPRQSQF